MKAATAEQMREIDKRTSTEIGIPSIVLMENASRAAAEVCADELKGISEPKIVVFAGKGNNGGDGFAIARILNDKGID
ncbi:MAG: bifunctional ADP-dependent NAD(P)H-hydrate dehydratase/NAD(P)H-hydrate epimerase, partial [Clostridiales bacterium]|nr:bifunctional ADP-dependent NAD(P)H-hydrate dehydratase/NAD(P)H-hydrate epimerase [Clostridiales bacterium]